MYLAVRFKDLNLKWWWQRFKDQRWQSTNLLVSRERKVIVRNIEEISGKKMILKETLVMLVLDKKTII